MRSGAESLLCCGSRAPAALPCFDPRGASQLPASDCVLVQKSPLTGCGGSLRRRRRRDQRLYVQQLAAGGPPQPVTAEGSKLRFADGEVDGGRGRCAWRAGAGGCCVHGSTAQRGRGPPLGQSCCRLAPGLGLATTFGPSSV